MNNEIERQKEELAKAWNGKKAKSTDDEIVKALAPIFLAFPQVNPTEEWIQYHCLMLRDIDPDTLAAAVLSALADAEYAPTVGTIRKHLPDKRAPEANSEANWDELPPAPPGGFKMFRLPEDEDKRQRMERLRNTHKWGSKYG